MKAYAIYSLKGGVGKTTTAVNLAWCAAESGKKVLLWDLDPQGAATFLLEAKADKQQEVGFGLFEKKKLSKFIVKTKFKGIDVIPGLIAQRNLELFLDKQKKSRKQVAEALKGVREDYDYVIIDSPPAIGRVAENIFEAADKLIMPMIPTTLSERAYRHVKKFYNRKGWDISRIVPFFSMVDNRKRLHKDTVRHFKIYNVGVPITAVPYLSIIEQMGIKKGPVGSYASTSEAANGFRNLWLELIK